MSSAPLLSKQAGQRVLRFLHVAFIAAIFLQFGILVFLKQQDRPLDRAIMFVFLAVALVIATVALVMRFFVLPKIDEEAAAMETVLPRRFKMYVVAFALAECIWLFGFVLSFLGAPLIFAITFLAMSLALLLLCTPRQV
jgi:hypothetical protein